MLTFNHNAIEIFPKESSRREINVKIGENDAESSSINVNDNQRLERERGSFVLQKLYSHTCRGKSLLVLGCRERQR